MAKKYDCTKLKDFVHEINRMCKTQSSCKACPLGGAWTCRNVYDDDTQEKIDVVQKWSDEHPEKPKLTKRDSAFLECFKYKSGKSLERDGVDLFLSYDDVEAALAGDMFSFIQVGESMTLEELSRLEVEDE